MTRPALPPASAKYLAKRAAKLTSAGNTKLESDKAWKAARRTKKVQRAFDTLVTMNAGSKRCMYCEHDRATDIDHHCPRDHNPGRTFDWANWLLACKVCNSNNKRNQYPVGLLDPSAPGYAFEAHFELARTTGAFDLKTAQARATAPVFGLNDSELEQARKHALVFFQLTIIQYARAKDNNKPTEATMCRNAVRFGHLPTVLATIQRWHKGPGRDLLNPDCVQAIDRYPEIRS